MSFWQKLRNGFSHFMAGRHGPDQLTRALLIMGLACYLLGAILGSIQGSMIWAALGLTLNTFGFAVYIFSIFRIFSRNEEKRGRENRRYVSYMDDLRKKWRQAAVRRKNRDKYTYFKCPNCKAWLRLPKGSGVVTVTCGRCHNSFTQKG